MTRAGGLKDLIKVGTPKVNILFQVPERGRDRCDCGAPIAPGPDGNPLHLASAKRNKDGVLVAPPHFDFCPKATLRY